MAAAPISTGAAGGTTLTWLPPKPPPRVLLLPAAAAPSRFEGGLLRPTALSLHECASELRTLRERFDDALAFGISMQAEANALRRATARRATDKASANEAEASDSFDEAFKSAEQAASPMHLVAVFVFAFLFGQLSKAWFRQATPLMALKVA
eukprot:CAMPEP_0184211848 /NCGR_PEP_ID=MMETSP0976-20121227/13337_1 /TAXON_ID=483370 /ORGANISM="non described non described, Strain CCMP2097" /LENGTH=151 /DNA_ID=CAMNT_0026516557 /DNA_START=1 /DNA_END=453 /DNA_ORIENTATION=+